MMKCQLSPKRRSELYTHTAYLGWAGAVQQWLARFSVGGWLSVTIPMEARLLLYFPCVPYRTLKKQLSAFSCWSTLFYLLNIIVWLMSLLY